MSLYSYHVFMFPFQWTPKGREGEDFDERHKLNKILPQTNSQWENKPQPESPGYQTELYNEKNFFYKFVHNALYDDDPKKKFPTIKHYERKEAYKTNLIYEIGVIANSKSVYKLHLKSIGLDMFSTGTGVLIFYLENHDYPEFDNVRRINQFGRRIFPPFLDKTSHVEATKFVELADYIAITGLMGESYRYHEDFTQFKTTEPWGKARFIKSLIDDFSPAIEIEPVVDDRMFTMCWYFNNKLSNEIKDSSKFQDFAVGDQWHQFLYVDGGDSSTCQNDIMREDLLAKNTYSRWQKWGTLYGMTKYSFMAISNDSFFPRNILLTHFRTMYVRLVEMVLIQRASILKFSAEVTRLSSLDEKDSRKPADQISDFYKAYIRFVNQIFFREITAQEQGIDLYDLLTDNMRIKDQVKDLDNEIGELHNYASLLDEKSQSRNLSLLTILGSLFLIPSFIVGFFGMNFFKYNDSFVNTKIGIIGAIIILSATIMYGIYHFTKKGKRRIVSALIVIMILLAVCILFTSSIIQQL